MVAKDNLSGSARENAFLRGQITGLKSGLRATCNVTRAIEYGAAQQAVIEAAKAMRDQQPDSVRALYAAVDALRTLEDQG